MLRIRERQSVLGKCFLHELSSEMLSAVPEALHHRPELRHAGARISPQVEFPIKLKIFFQGGQTLQLVDHSVERRNIRVGEVWDTLDDRQRLHDLAYLVDLNRFLRI